jgi:hypothetical protein
VRLEPTDPTAAAADLDGSRGGILKFWKIASWLTGEIIRLGAWAFRIDRLINRVRRAWPFRTKFRIFQRLLGFFLTDYLRHRIATFRLSPIFGRGGGHFDVGDGSHDVLKKRVWPLNSGMQISIRDTESFLDEGAIIAGLDPTAGARLPKLGPSDNPDALRTITFQP